MADQRPILYSGGCQCGAVRYALYAEPYGTHLCHCRMCQKAFGAFYAPLTLIRYADFAWTRGGPALFRSSPEVTRGFCADCGTPLTFAHDAADYLNLSVGSLDHPEHCKPEIQIGTESRMPWAAELPHLKEMSTDQALAPERLVNMKTFQHPDHDTDDWPDRSGT